MKRMRMILIPVLVLAFALFGQMLAARPVMAPANMVEICAEGGPTLVLIGEDGVPLPDDKSCRCGGCCDCAIVTAFDFPAQPECAGITRMSQVAVTAMRNLWFPRNARHFRSARGPPAGKATI